MLVSSICPCKQENSVPQDTGDLCLEHAQIISLTTLAKKVFLRKYKLLRNASVFSKLQVHVLLCIVSKHLALAPPS